MQQLTGQLVIGRPVKLNRVTPKRGANSDQHNRSARIRTYDLNWRGQAAPPSRDQGNRGAPYAFDRWASTASASDHWQKPVLDGSRLYIGGLPRIEPQSTAQAEVLKIFDGFNVLAVSKMISPHTSSHSTPGSHYYCFVDLQDAHEAATAVQELNGQPTQWGGTLKVDRARAPGDKVMGEQFRE